MSHYRQPGKSCDDGTTARIVQGHNHGHKVDTEILSKNAHSIVSHIFDGVRDWFVMLVFDDGSAAMFGQAPKTEPPPIEASHKMLEIGRALNEEMAHGGYWMVAWHPQQRISMIFCNQLGRPLFTSDVDDAWARVRKLNLEDFLQRAMAATLEYTRFNQMAGFKMTEKAQPTNLTLDPSWDPGKVARN